MIRRPIGWLSPGRVRSDAAARARAARGFTLIEMAIALVVIGIVLVAVLQGRQMIASAEYKSFKRALSGYAEAFYTFRERYNALPGDFTEAAARLGSTAPPSDSAGNGLIDDGPTCVESTDESCLAWQHLRAASLIKGDPSKGGTEASPEHPYNGLVSGFFTSDEGNGEFGHKMLVQDLPAEIGRRLDDDVDDGRCNAGRVSSNDCDGSDDWPDDGDVDLIYAL